MGTLNATFCLAGFRAQRGNVEAAHGPGKLSFTRSRGGVFIINPEYAGFIAVKDHGFTVFFDIATGRFKVSKDGLRFHKQQVHQTTGGIVDIDQCRTGPTPVCR